MIPILTHLLKKESNLFFLKNALIDVLIEKLKDPKILFISFDYNILRFYYSLIYLGIESFVDIFKPSLLIPQFDNSIEQ